MVFWGFVAQAVSITEEKKYEDYFVKESTLSYTQTQKCSCVILARYYTGRKDFSGWAGLIKPKTQIPYVGGIMITSEGNGHVAVITEVRESELEVIESNYITCQISRRTVDRKSTFIIVYI